MYFSTRKKCVDCFPTQKLPSASTRPVHFYLLHQLTGYIGGITYFSLFFFFLIYLGYPGQLTRTTTIPHGPLDILQAQEQVRHRGGDRRTHRGSNPERGRNKSHELTTAVKPSSAGYTRELEPGHSGRAKPAKTTELQAPCVFF